MNIARLVGALLLSSLSTVVTAQQTSPEVPANAPYKNPALPLEQRVNDLVSRMTLEEKVSQLGHTADAVPRLGIPEYNRWNVGLHGVARAGIATVFPQAIGMAATFDEPLMHEIATTISTEFRAKYNAERRPDGSTDWYRGLTVWSPNINIFRDPRWGRGQETYGEDPFLTSRMGLAFVTGLQGDDPKYLKTVATPKHFAVHSGPEPTRHSVDVQASRHDMEDTYFPAFRATIMQGKAESVMCAYNSLNGQPACANTVLLDEHLRRDWGFQGYVVSDCGAVTDISDNHHFTKTMEEGVAAAIKAGTDLICGNPRTRVKTERDAALKAVQEGILSEADIDRAMKRLFTARFRLGMFDPPSAVPFSQLGISENDTEQHRQLALRTARESLVLLKNQNNFLPLKKTYQTIAVIGPDADNLDALVGNYNGTPSHPVTIVDGIRKRFSQSKIVYSQGVGLTGPIVRSIPSDSLFTDTSRKQHGLKADYFGNVDLKGAPVMSRVDADVNFAWGDRGISPQLLKNYSVRWTGVIVPPITGDYLVGFTGQDGFRMWLDGKLVAEEWTIHHPADTITTTVHLEKGHAYSVKIEYFQTIRSAEARLVWSKPGDGQEVIDVARNSDLVIMVLGLSPRIEGEEMNVHTEGFSGGDRTSLDLPVPQKELLEQIYALGKPMILVLTNGSALGVNWADDHVPAILEAWYPGEEGGTAVAEAIAGDFSPGGRLPVTFYKSIDQLPAFEDYSMAKRTYRYFDGEPLYPFGYGLSYTTFAYRNLKIDSPSIAADGTVRLSVDVVNTGQMEAEEVVELYLTHQGVQGAAIRALKGFQRITLDAGDQRTVSFTLSGRDLGIVDPEGKHRIVPGTVNLWIGGGQPISRNGATPAGVKGQFSITSEVALPD